MATTTVKTPPRRTGDAAADILAISDWLWDLYQVVALLTPLANAKPVAGWADPTGTGDRTTFDMDWTQAVSASPAQAEVQAIVTQIEELQKRLGQLVLDQKTVGTIAA